jgi:hypothetical protein
MNRNDRKTARADFLAAYRLDSGNSFAINNMGFLAELDGDKETAQTYYEQAQDALRSHAKVAVATRVDVEGREMRYVAQESSELMESSIEAKAEVRRTTGGRPTLKTRSTDRPKNYTPPEFRNPQPQKQNEPTPQPPKDSKKPPQ